MKPSLSSFRTLRRLQAKQGRNLFRALVGLKLAFLASLGMTFSVAAHAKPYPAEMQRAFMESCAGLNRELVHPCRCILRNLEKSIPHESFEKLVAKGKAEQDPRIAAIARQCAERY